MILMLITDINFSEVTMFKLRTYEKRLLLVIFGSKEHLLVLLAQILDMLLQLLDSLL